MRRIFGAHAYGPGPVQQNFWASTVPDAQLACPAWAGNGRADVVVVGAGFTGLSAALALAQAGADVVVLDAGHPGWGASGRNGGFCCLGGAKASAGQIAARIGAEGLAEWQRSERRAIDTVAALLQAHQIDADCHSQGETLLAHSPRAMAQIVAGVGDVARAYGVAPVLHDRADLAGLGMNGPFHGGMTLPLGFALNPRKYLLGLLRAAQQAGARVFGGSPVQRIDSDSTGHSLHLPQGSLQARRLVLATNGYASEDVPPWMAARYMPAQSNVLVTRKLTAHEQQAAGWSSAQMAFDSRHLLHYFRLMPDGRFLFGRRGGLLSSARADRAAAAVTERHFRAMFPAWAHVEVPWGWSGMVCLSAHLLPYCGPVPGIGQAWAGFAYHGNGVAMGSFTGQLLAGLVLGRPSVVPKAMQIVPPRFALGRLRRVWMPFVYAGAALADLR